MTLSTLGHLTCLKVLVIILTEWHAGCLAAQRTKGGDQELTEVAPGKHHERWTWTKHTLLGITKSRPLHAVQDIRNTRLERG